LNTFAADFVCDAGNVTTPLVQSWLDARKLAPQGYTNFRRVLHLLFEFAVARGYASDNPVAASETVKVNGRDIAVYTPSEVAKLLAAATPEFKPVLVLQAFAGLRSAEVERLEWSDIHLAERQVIIGASRAKTASRRIAPLSDNAVEWLRPYSGQTGKVWRGSHEDFYQAQQDTAQAASVKWKANALRHSAASYMFALSNDAGRVAGFLGNSAAMIHRHYRELVRPQDAQRWFAVRPEQPANILPLPTPAAIANA
jgi:integrase